MVFVTQNDMGGLGGALQQVGGALGQAFQKRGQRERQQRAGNVIQQALAQAQEGGQPLNAQGLTGVLSSLIGQGVDPQLLSPFLQILQPQLKEQAKVSAYQNYHNPMESSQQNLSPIDQIKVSQQEKITPEGISVTDKEQIQPEGEFESAVDAPLFRGKPITEEVIEKYARSPFARDNKTADRLSTQVNEYNKLKGKYNLETAKENRAAVKEYAKPYLDLTKLKATEKKISRLNELITDKKVGRNANLKSFLNALLEGKGNEKLTEIFKTPEEQELGYLLRDFYNTKEIGGSNPSTKEVMLTLATLVDRFKTPEANAKIGKGLLEHARSMRLKGESSLKNLDKGMKLGEFISTVENDVQHLNSFIEASPKDTVPMRSPQGELWHIKKNKINEAKKKKFKEL